MIASLKTKLNQKRLIIGTTAITAILAMMTWTTSTSIQNYRAANELKSGVNTCFTRINQTLTALLIGDFSAEYVQTGFTADTQDCLSESLSFFEKNLKGQINIQKELNSLSTDTYWFHEKVGSISSLAQRETVNVQSSNIIDKYVKLENYKLNTSDKVDQFISNQENALKANQWGMGLIAAAVILVAASLSQSEKKKKKIISAFENEALALVQNKSKNLTHIDRFMTKVTEFWNMPNTYEVVNELESLITLNSSKVYIEDTSSAIGSFIQPEISDDAANVTESFNISLNQLKEKAFTAGVIIDFDLPDEVWVKGKKDSVDQLLFTVCNEAIERSIQKDDGNKKITIRSKTLGGVVYFKLSNAYENFAQDTIDYFSGTNMEPKDININLMMIKELIKDSDAQIKLSNRREKDVRWAQIEISFFASKKPDRRVMVKKGKKKDILREISGIN